jgi:hypothetical protein
MSNTLLLVVSQDNRFWLTFDIVGEPCFQRDASSRADNTNSSSELTFDLSEGFANSIKWRESHKPLKTFPWKGYLIQKRT